MRGWRAKIGLMIPSTNSTMEPDFNRLAPEGVTIHSARLKTKREATFETLREMEKLVIPAAKSLADCEVNAICYGCTSGSFLEGPSYSTRIEENIKNETGIAAITTANAMVESIKELGLKKITVVSPYVQATNERLIDFLEELKIKVVSLKAFDLLDQFEYGNYRFRKCALLSVLCLLVLPQNILALRNDDNLSRKNLWHNELLLI